MADRHSKETRRFNMSRIKGKDTKPEMLVRRFLHANGVRFRLHVKELLGRPDIVLPKYKTLIFVHGCFWHGHEGCKYATIPKTRTEWWTNKIRKTNLKDYQNVQKLREDGWSVIRIFECELRKAQRQHTLTNLLFYLNAPSLDTIYFESGW